MSITLYHYTDETGYEGIESSGKIKATEKSGKMMPFWDEEFTSAV